MFRYWAMALEADFDEFGYTDASDIEIESEIQELGDDYEAPEPEFQRKLHSTTLDLPGSNVPLSHPAVLPSHAKPPIPSQTEGMIGVPAQASPQKLAAARTSTKMAEAEPAGAGAKPSPKPDRPVKQGKSKATSTAAPSRTEPPDKEQPLPKKTPAKEQIAPLAGKAILPASKKSARGSMTKKNAAKSTAQKQSTQGKSSSAPAVKAPKTETVSKAAPARKPAASSRTTAKESGKKSASRQGAAKPPAAQSSKATRKSAQVSQATKASGKPLARETAITTVGKRKADKPAKTVAAVGKASVASKTAKAVNGKLPLAQPKKPAAKVNGSKRGTTTESPQKKSVAQRGKPAAKKVTNKKTAK